MQFEQDSDSPRETSRDLCEREPIHAPESIQPHGYIFAINAKRQLTRVSENLANDLCFQAQDIVGLKIEDCPKSLRELLKQCLNEEDPGSHASSRADPLADSLTDSLTGSLAKLPDQIVFFNNKKMILTSFTNSANASAAHECEIFFELEPSLLQVHTRAFKSFQNGIETLAKQRGVSELCHSLAKSVREMLEYDRVLVYRFDSNWNGSVVGESKKDTSESFLGLHFPASDIPAQARALYTVSTSRQIMDALYTPSPVISMKGCQQADLTHSKFRSISPAHIQYMRNMGVRASLTVSLMNRGQLWGLLTAHHFNQPKNVAPILRNITQTLCQVSSQFIAGFEDASASQKVIERNMRLKILAQFFEQSQVSDEILGKAQLDQVQSEILAITQSKGFILRTSSEPLGVGELPPQDEWPSLIEFFEQALGSEKIYVTDRLAEAYARAAHFMETSSGCLVVRLPQVDLENEINAMAIWFRPEIVSELKWAGNPEKSVQIHDGKISPRNSFSEFVQKIKGRSAEWNENDFGSAFEFQDQYRIRCNRIQEKKLRQTIAENAIKQGKIEAISRIMHDIGNALSGVLPKVTQKLGEDEWQEIDSLHNLIALFYQNADQFEHTLGTEKFKALLHFTDSLKTALQNRSKSIQTDWQTLSKSLLHVEHILQLQRLLAPAGARKLTQKCQLNELIQNVIEMSAGFLLPHKIEALTELNVEAIIEIDQTNMMRVLMNLIKNAAESIAAESPQKRRILVKLSRTDPHSVSLTISDTGKGFTEDEKTLIHSIKGHSSKKNGGGQGLESCREILRSIGSRLELTSPGLHQGATARIDFYAPDEGVAG